MALFSKPHFAQIAEVLRGGIDKAQSRTTNYGRTYGEGYREGMVDLTTQLADIFERDNQDFDRERFYNDVGLDGYRTEENYASIPTEEERNARTTARRQQPRS